jgi:large subunit ribosomal protein L9
VKVVLRADVTNVGKKGDIVDLAPGYVRNFLAPKGLAFVATDGVVAQAQAMRKSRDQRDAADRTAAEEIARALVPAVIVIKTRAVGNKLFGSITSVEVAQAVAEQTKIVLDRKKIFMNDHIKTTGQHAVPVKLHSDVQFAVTVEVLAL